MGGRATSTTTRVLVISGSVGAGHDGAANELISRLAKRGVVVDRRDYLDALPRVCSYILRDGYRWSSVTGRRSSTVVRQPGTHWLGAAGRPVAVQGGAA